MRWQLQDPHPRGMFVLGVAKGLQVMEDLPPETAPEKRKTAAEDRSPIHG